MSYRRCRKSVRFRDCGDMLVLFSTRIRLLVRASGICERDVLASYRQTGRIGELHSDDDRRERA